MASNVAETLIGAGVLAAAAGFFVYAANTADVDAPGTGYRLQAEFNRAEGISQGGDVRIAGVKVGTVAGMSLDPRRYKAVVTMTIRDGIEIPDDSSISIKMAGLLGDSFLAVQPGASDIMLEDGEAFGFTQDSVGVSDILSTLIAGGGEGQ